MKQQMQDSGILWLATHSNCHLFLWQFFIHSYRTGGTTSITLHFCGLVIYSIDPSIYMILRYAATAGSLLACNDLFAVLEDQKKWHWVTIFTSIDHTGQFKRKWGCPQLRTRKVISSQNFWGFLDGFLRVSTVDDWHLAAVDKSVYPPYKFTSTNSVFLNKIKIHARWRAPFFEGSSEMMNIFT